MTNTKTKRKTKAKAKCPECPQDDRMHPVQIAAITVIATVLIGFFTIALYTEASDKAEYEASRPRMAQLPVNTVTKDSVLINWKITVEFKNISEYTPEAVENIRYSVRELVGLTLCRDMRMIKYDIINIPSPDNSANVLRAEYFKAFTNCPGELK